MKSFQIDDKTILFNTGRMYSSDGQIIIAERREKDIAFVDTVRRISGVIFNCPLIIGNILDAYGRGAYEHSLPMEKRIALENLSLVHRYKII